MLERLGIHLTPLTLRRWIQFRANRRGWWSLWLFLLLFGLSLGRSSSPTTGRCS